MKWLVAKDKWINLDRLELIKFYPDRVLVVFSDGYENIGIPEGTMQDIKENLRIFIGKEGWQFFDFDDYIKA